MFLFCNWARPCMALKVFRVNRVPSAPSTRCFFTYIYSLYIHSLLKDFSEWQPIGFSFGVIDLVQIALRPFMVRRIIPRPPDDAQRHQRPQCRCRLRPALPDANKGKCRLQTPVGQPTQTVPPFFNRPQRHGQFGRGQRRRGPLGILPIGQRNIRMVADGIGHAGQVGRLCVRPVGEGIAERFRPFGTNAFLFSPVSVGSFSHPAILPARPFWANLVLWIMRSPMRPQPPAAGRCPMAAGRPVRCGWGWRVQTLPPLLSRRHRPWRCSRALNQSC